MRFERLHEEVNRVLAETTFLATDLAKLVPAPLMLRLKKKGIDAPGAIVNAIEDYPINPQKLREYLQGDAFKADLEQFEKQAGYISKDQTLAFWDAKIGTLSNVAVRAKA